MESNYFDELNYLESAYHYLRNVVPIVPKIGMVLGSGWGNCLTQFNCKVKINYDDIPFFPKSTVEHHHGNYLIGELNDVPTIVMQGRIHYYEGYTINEVVRPIRIMKMLGANKMILTNASGSLNPSFEIGDFVLIKDHIASFIPSPTRTLQNHPMSKRFPDMSMIYDSRMRKMVKKVATRHGITLKEGVYLQTAGSHFESPSEIRMYQVLGADMVGMSTACEAIAAKQMEMEVVAIAYISNMASGLTEDAITFEDIANISKIHQQKFETILASSVEQLGKDA